MHSTPLPYTAPSCSRQQKIEDCLFENMLKQPYESIKVADLCRQQHISRKTFYDYFNSKNACLCSYIDRIIRDAILHTNTAVLDDPDPKKSAVIFLDYWKQQKTFLDLIQQNDLYGLFLMQHFTHFLSEEKTLLNFLNTPNMKSDPEIMNCYLSCILTLILQWHFHNFNTPTEEVAEKYLRIIHQPMIPRSEDHA